MRKKRSTSRGLGSDEVHSEDDRKMNQLPKVELHLHLDCSLSYKAVSRLDPKISLKEFETEFIAPSQCASLTEFLTRASRGFQLMQTEEALRLVTEDVFQQLASDNVIYAEIRFAPLLHLERGLSPEAVVAAVDRATEDCIRATGIEARLILCTLRHFSEEQSMLTAKLVERFRGSHVVALDLAGDEAGFPIDAHRSAFRLAMELGIDRTAHSGEAADASSVWETLQVLQPMRIGHGMQSAEDPKLIEYLKANRIHLEICPSSNVQTRACLAYEEHPVNSLLRQGVSLGISTDTRTTTDVSLSDEYERLSKHFGWDEADFLACNRAAMEAAFVDEQVRERLMAKL